MRLIPAAAAHAADLAQVHAQAFDRPWPASDIAALLDSPGVFGFLAVEDRPGAMILCRAVLDEAEILTVGTAPAFRRRGAARALVEICAETARSAGAASLFLEVAVDNLAAVGLYESLGFQRTGLRAGYYDRGVHGKVDALAMRRDLNAG